MGLKLLNHLMTKSRQFNHSSYGFHPCKSLSWRASDGGPPRFYRFCTNISAILLVLWSAFLLTAARVHVPQHSCRKCRRRLLFPVDMIDQSKMDSSSDEFLDEYYKLTECPFDCECSKPAADTPSEKDE